MVRAPLERFSGLALTHGDTAELRKFLLQILQRHMEKKLVTAGMLERL